MRVAFAADDSNEAVEAVREALRERSDLIEVAPNASWPAISEAVARAVADGEADFGVLMCWTGTGTAIAANKVPGIRAAQASDPWVAENARLERRQRAHHEPQADRPRRGRGVRRGLPLGGGAR